MVLDYYYYLRCQMSSFIIMPNMIIFIKKQRKNHTHLFLIIITHQKQFLLLLKLILILSLSIYINEMINVSIIYILITFYYLFLFRYIKFIFRSLILSVNNSDKTYHYEIFVFEGFLLSFSSYFYISLLQKY